MLSLFICAYFLLLYVFAGEMRRVCQEKSGALCVRVCVEVDRAHFSVGKKIQL